MMLCVFGAVVHVSCKQIEGNHLNVICGLLRDYTASCGTYLPTFRDNVSAPSSRVEIQDPFLDLDP
jgi:hypothetical protein